MAETILRGIEFVPQSDDTSNIRILPVDVYGPNPETTTFDVARGIYAAVNSGATVINLSMGGDADSPFLADVIQQANRACVLFKFSRATASATVPPVSRTVDRSTLA